MNGNVVKTLQSVAGATACQASCRDAKGPNGKNGYCEAWFYSAKDNSCELRQLSGVGSISKLFGDRSGVSWKRHSNFRGDCTPLWVDIAYKQNEQKGKQGYPALVITSGSQQQRDLACCRACAADDGCEAWVQATDNDDVQPKQCWLRRATQAASNPASAAGIVGAGYSDIDYHDKKPVPYFSERRNMVCADIADADRATCGVGGAGNGAAATDADECQSAGCCWDASAGQCFASHWRPVAILHGMGSRLMEYEKNILWLRAQYPGIYIVNLNVYPGPPGMGTKLRAQMARIRTSIASDPILAGSRGRGGFNFYGESQGGLLARSYVTIFNDPPVFNLVAISGPQAGVGMCPEVDMPIISTVCAGGAPVVGVYSWPDCSFCDFWKGLNEKEYLEKSNWLANVNNDYPEKNATHSENMKTLNFYMASVGSDDRVVQPRESAWHTFWKWGGKRKQADIVDWRETDGYKGDWLGLQTLDKQGKLAFNMYQGTHTSYNQTWWQSTVMPVFNTKMPN
eukprot:g515.t1